MSDTVVKGLAGRTWRGLFEDSGNPGQAAHSLTNQPTPSRFRQTWMVAALLTVSLLALPWALPPDGQQHGRWQQFFGRFHPVVVHLPIALLLLVPVLEIAGRSRPALREAAGFVLTCAAWCCGGSVLLGVLLAHGGGFTQEAVRGHMWTGIVLTAAVLFCRLLRPAWQGGDDPWMYPAMLFAIVLLTFWTGHQGGTITYGKGYLTQFAPRLSTGSGFRRTYPAVDPASIYATRVQPIFDAKCVSCHGPSKRKGGLRLDSYAHLMDGGTSGQAVAEGHPEKSILFTRITLPPSDRKFMPSDGKPALSAAEIALMRTWIQQGASPLAGPPSGRGLAPAAGESPAGQAGEASGAAPSLRLREQVKVP